MNDANYHGKMVRPEFAKDNAGLFLLVATAPFSYCISYELINTFFGEYIWWISAIIAIAYGIVAAIPFKKDFEKLSYAVVCTVFLGAATGFYYSVPAGLLTIICALAVEPALDGFKYRKVGY